MFFLFEDDLVLNLTISWVSLVYIIPEKAKSKMHNKRNNLNHIRFITFVMRKGEVFSKLIIINVDCYAY